MIRLLCSLFLFVQSISFYVHGRSFYFSDKVHKISENIAETVSDERSCVARYFQYLLWAVVVE